MDVRPLLTEVEELAAAGGKRKKREALLPPLRSLVEVTPSHRLVSALCRVHSSLKTSSGNSEENKVLRMLYVMLLRAVHGSLAYRRVGAPKYADEILTWSGLDQVVSGASDVDAQGNHDHVPRRCMGLRFLAAVATALGQFALLSPYEARNGERAITRTLSALDRAYTSVAGMLPTRTLVSEYAREIPKKPKKSSLAELSAIPALAAAQGATTYLRTLIRYSRTPRRDDFRLSTPLGFLQHARSLYRIGEASREHQPSVDTLQVFHKLQDAFLHVLVASGQRESGSSPMRLAKIEAKAGLCDPEPDRCQAHAMQTMADAATWTVRAGALLRERIRDTDGLQRFDFGLHVRLLRTLLRPLHDWEPAAINREPYVFRAALVALEDVAHVATVAECPVSRGADDALGKGFLGMWQEALFVDHPRIANIRTTLERCLYSLPRCFFSQSPAGKAAPQSTEWEPLRSVVAEGLLAKLDSTAASAHPLMMAVTGKVTALMVWAIVAMAPALWWNPPSETDDGPHAMFQTILFNVTGYIGEGGRDQLLQFVRLHCRGKEAQGWLDDFVV